MRALLLAASLGPTFAFAGIAGCELAYPTHEADSTGDATTDSAKDSAKDAAVDGDAFIPGKCKPTGLYCGNDKVPGDPDVLYRCVADADAVVVERCEAGCAVAPPGYDDDCVR